MILILIILLIFLKDWVASLVAVMNIPLSILGVFFMMTLTKYMSFMGEVTINIMSLGGLTLAIGLIVDDSVVVIENIFRKRQQGMDITIVTSARTNDEAFEFLKMMGMPFAEGR